MMNFPRRTNIYLSQFAADRHKPGTGLSYFEGTAKELIERVYMGLEDGSVTQGYRDGVIVVEVDSGGFYSGIATLKESSRLTASFRPRREGEDPRVDIRVIAVPQPAERVDIILYRHDVLAQNHEQSVNDPDSWEVISINAYPTEEQAPMPPMTMARNFLGMAGGTTGGQFTAEDFARSIVYWAQHAFCNKS